MGGLEVSPAQPGGTFGLWSPQLMTLHQCSIAVAEIERRLHQPRATDY